MGPHSDAALRSSWCLGKHLSWYGFVSKATVTSRAPVPMTAHVPSLSMATKVVIDTSVFVAALIGRGGPNREGLRRCLRGTYQPLMGNALIAEYEDVVARPRIRELCPVKPAEVQDLLEAFCSVCEWVPIYYLLRPNLADEGDNHLLELAAAGNASWVVTNNVRDFSRPELVLPGISVITPEQLLQEH